MTVEQSAAAAAFARQRAAMGQRGISGPEKAVLMVLAIMANADGEAWPSITTIAENASLGRRTVFDALDRLEAHEPPLIERRVSQGKGTTYRLPFADRATPTSARAAPVQTPHQCGSRTSAGAAPVREPHSTGAGAAPKQPRTTNTYLDAGAPEAIEVVSGLPPGTDSARWFEYAEMRAAMAKGPKGRPWTAGARATALRTLAKLQDAGHAPDAVLEQSVLNGWQGLFPPRETGNDQRNRAGSRNGHGGPADAYLEALRRVSAGDQCF